jgi:uncharacterized RDD family membrane protein YckC
MFCQNCGAELEDGDVFCSYCGTNIESDIKPIMGAEVKKRLCPKCGTELKGGEKFCGFCGADTESIEGVEAGKGFCPECGVELEDGDRFCINCGATLEYIEKEKPKQADAGRRFLSFIIDCLCVCLVSVVVGLMWGIFLPNCELNDETSEIMFLVATIAYFSLLFGTGQTIGMMVMKLKLCRTDGTYPIGYGRGFLRFVAMIVPSSLFLYMGFIWILIDKENQGWHDKIADTYVIMK